MRTTFSVLSSRTDFTLSAKLPLSTCSRIDPELIRRIDGDHRLVWVSGLSTVLPASGSLTLTPFCSIGAMSIMMMSSTSMTSTSGVTLMSALRLPLAAEVHCHGETPALRRVVDAVSRRAGSAAGRETGGRDSEIALRRLLDEVVEELGRRVVHFDVEVLDPAGEVIVEPHRGDRDDQPERRFDERFRNTGRDRAETARSGRRDALEGRDDADDRAEQTDEGSRRADGRERRNALSSGHLRSAPRRAGWRGGRCRRGPRGSALNRSPAGIDIPAARRARPWRGDCSGSSWTGKSRSRPSAGRP